MNYQKMIEGIQQLDQAASLAPLSRVDHFRVQSIARELLQEIETAQRPSPGVNPPNPPKP